jgi:hypothetical protein
LAQAELVLAEAVVLILQMAPIQFFLQLLALAAGAVQISIQVHNQILGAMVVLAVVAVD